MAKGKEYLTPARGKGKELCDLLRRELGIPDSIKTFEIRFAIGEVITYRIEGYATEQEPIEGIGGGQGRGG